MALIADGLLLAAALTAALYCHVLAARLKRLRSMEGGVGQAVAAMSSQVEEMRAALKAAKAAAGDSTRTLAERTARAEMAAGRLELLLAALHDREGSAPVDLGARRARATTRRSPVGAGASNAGSDGTPASAAPHPDSASAEAPPPDDAADAPPVRARAAAPDPAGHATEEAAAMPRGRARLFRLTRPPEAAPAPAGQAGTPDAERQAADLRAALEALARESVE